MLIALLSSLSGCVPAEASPLRLRGGRTNVLLILVDGLGAEGLGQATPQLQTLGEHGVRFDQLIANGVQPRSAAGALLTGQHPRQLQLAGRRSALDEEQQTLAEVMHEHGYLTLGLGASPELDSYYGFAQGFATYEDPPLDGGSGPLDVSDRALRLLDRNVDEDQRDPWLLQVHFREPGPPWSASRSEVNARREAGSPDPRGEAELAVLDRGIGDLLAGLSRRGLLEETLVVVVGTHGPEAATLSESGLQVPLILEHPALPSGHRVEQLCDQVDLLPTLMHLLAWEALPDLEGESLAGLALGAPRDEALSGLVVSETGWSPEDRTALRTHRHKLLRDPERGLLLYRVDQGQETLVQDDHIQRRLAERLRSWEATHPRP